MGNYQRNDGPYGPMPNGSVPTRGDRRYWRPQQNPNGRHPGQYSGPQTPGGPQYPDPRYAGPPYAAPYGRPSTYPAYPGPQPPYLPNPGYAMAQERPKASRVPFIVLGVILLLMVGMCVSCSVIAGNSASKGMQVLSEKQAQWCQIKNAQPTEGLDSEKAVREAERLTDVHKGESRWSVCSTLMGEYDEQTATWALGQVDVDWGRNALRYAELNDLKDEDPADDNGNEMITMRLKIAGFTQQQIDYAKAHWDETIGDGDTEDATPQHDEHGSNEEDDSL